MDCSVEARSDSDSLDSSLKWFFPWRSTAGTELISAAARKGQENESLQHADVFMRLPGPFNGLSVWA